MTRSQILRPILGIAALSLVLGIAESRADERGTKADALVEARDTGGLSWDVAGDYSRLELSISGPGGLTLHREFRPGDVLRFDIYDDFGQLLPDGRYKYELSFVPRVTKAQRRAMEAVRASADPQAATHASLPARVPTHSGAFTIRNGAVVQADLPETPLALGPAIDAAGSTSAASSGDISLNSQVFATDLIVQGSGCFGLDCVSNESFGFDTLRLKENNLRIKFDDTSNSGSFPNNDWQITANDSVNRGLNRFSIDDVTHSRTPFTIEANAPSNSLYVDDGGRVGFGTSTPAVNLHVVFGNTPALRLEQNGSSGFNPQTWDVAGNETVFFVRDVTNGSKLPFKIFPNAPTNSLNIQGSSGNVGIGTTSPDARLHVEAGTSATAMHVKSTVGSGPNNLILLENSGPARLALFNSAASTTGGNEQTWILNSNGTFRIGAGTSFTPLTLDTAGNLTVTGSYKVNGTTLIVPDYVFEPGYKLMPLDELNTFVTTNRHLPEVPSAAAVTQGELDMTQMQLKLLQKVEELTLYTLQQQATIEKLQAKLDALEHRNP
jgi:hypothetical protein